MDSGVDLVKARILEGVPLPTLVGDTVKLQSRGGRLVGLCPFHREKSPSFTVFDNGYFCFGCRASGDAITFVRQTRGLGFIEALRFLGDRFHIDVAELDRDQLSEEKVRKTRLHYQILASAQDFYAKVLLSPKGQKARDYLLSRGLTQEDIAAFGLGLTPEHPAGLCQTLLQDGASLDDLVTVSLARSRGRVQDFFRDRLLVPIRDSQGRVIAFGGRTMVDHPAKYLNSAETYLFDKSRVVFGLDRARSEIRRKQRAIVVEGYMDVLQLWRSGFQETVGCMGTALTAHQLRQVSPLPTHVHLLFDGDSAGRAATLRTVKASLDVPAADVRVTLVPDGDDPDTWVQKVGSQGLEQALTQESTDLLTFAIDQKIRESGDSTQIPQLVSRDFIPWLSAIEDPIRRDFLLTRVAARTGMSREVLQDQIRPKRKRSGATHDAPHPGGSMNQEDSGLVPVADPGPEGFDLLGHLLFATPTDKLDPSRILTLARSLTLHPAWEATLEDMLRSLKDGTRPVDAAWTSWRWGSHPQVAQTLQQLSRMAGGFRGVPTLAQLERLERAIQQRRIRQTIRTLKDQLRGPVEAATQVEILSQIKQLQTEETRLAPGPSLLP